MMTSQQFYQSRQDEQSAGRDIEHYGQGHGREETKMSIPRKKMKKQQLRMLG